MAATSTALELLDAGSHIVTGDDLYGGSWRLFERVRRRSMGLDFAYVDLSDIAAVEAAITPKTKMIWVETPTNPLMKLADIAALSKVAKAHGLLLVGRQHLRHAVLPAAAGAWAPTSSCIRRPNT